MSPLYTQDPLEPALRQGMLTLGLPDTQHHVEGLLRYIGLMMQWNKVYNLTSVRDPKDMLVLHILDSLAVIQPLQRHTQGRPTTLLDVGAGAGLPGLVIALMCPEISVTSIDAVAKKVAFMTQVGATLQLENFTAVHGRVEKWQSQGFDVVTSRAFASLADFTQWTMFHVKHNTKQNNGVWMALKGKQPDDEISNLSPTVQVLEVESLLIPGLDANRCLVWLAPTVD